MERRIEKKLKKWKEGPGRKPLVIKGARQIGKSYSIEHFAKNHYKKFLRIDFLQNDDFHKIFSENQNLDPHLILEKIAILSKMNFDLIDLKETLLFFDEIQECPRAITSLKFFYEKIPDLSIISAGSYLGIMANEHSFPVGKVEYLSMTPMNFCEFLQATDRHLFTFFKTITMQEESDLLAIDSFYHDQLVKTWKDYLVIGGMPEVVKTYIENKNNKILALKKMRVIQNQLLEGYRSDFSKYSGKFNSTHILHVFESIPNQLSKAFDENVAKYKFSDIIPRQKGFDSIRGPLSWLSQSRLVIKNLIAIKAQLPLSAYTEENKFKLFFLDIGLLGAALKIPVEQYILEEISEYKGYIVENFMACELFHLYDDVLYSWSEGQSEVEFLLNSPKGPLGLEVKSSAKFRKSKSLDSFVKKYKPAIAFKISAKNMGINKETNILSIPFYLLSEYLIQNKLVS